MTKIRVKMCCHSSESTPKFFAEIGDKVLVNASETALQELIIQDISGEGATCVDANGARRDIRAEDIRALIVN